MLTRQTTLARKLEALAMAPFAELQPGCDLPESLDRTIDVPPPKPVIRPSVPPAFPPRKVARRRPIAIRVVQFDLLSDDF